MRILLDRNLNWRLGKLLQPHDVLTTRQMLWDELGNGELLNEAQNEFDVMLTTDANLYHQQKVSNYDLSVIVLRAYNNSITALAPLLDQLMELLEQILPGETRYIYADEALRLSDQRRGRGPFANAP